MVHKRYVKKRGKVFGPYYYESYRDGDKVKKRYLGGEKEYKELLKADKRKKEDVEKNLKEFKVSRKKSEIIGKFLRDNIFKGALGKKPKSMVLVEQPLKPLFSNLNRKLFIFIFLAVLFIIAINANFSLVGYVIGYDEEIKESYDKEVELEIKKPVKIFGESISSNENERMDFKINGGLRLYFELLNYTNYVGEIENIVEKEKIEKEKKKEEKAEEKEGKEKIEDKSNRTIEINESYKEIEENKTIIELVNKTEIENKTELEEEEIGENETNIEGTGKRVKEEINDTKIEVVNETTDVVQLPQESQEKEEKIEKQEEKVEEKIKEEIPAKPEPKAGITGNIIKFFGLIGRVVGIEFNETKNISPLLEVNITLQEIKEKAENLTQEEIKIIEDNSVATSDEFEIVVNETLARDSGVDYKWGYKVKLNDEKFIARIDVTSNNSITQYDDYVLQIGRSLLSFKDLVEQGYDVKFEKPELMEEILIDVSEKIVNETIEINESYKEVEENKTIVELVNKTDETEIENKTELKEEEIGENETIEKVEKEKVKEESEKEEVEEEQTELTNKTTEEVKEEKIEIIVNETTDVVQLPQENEVNETIAEEKKVEEEKDEKQEEKEKIERQEEKVEEEILAKPEPEAGITGNIVRFFGLIGRVVLGEPEVEDIYYENTFSVYIERDFSEYIERENENNKENKKIPSLISGVNYLDIDNSSSLNLGDILILDPSLIIIPITKAEHLDENRSFISDIYDYVKEKDDNWSEVINNSHYVRVSFQQKIGKTNDITVFARAVAINEAGEIEVYKQDGNEIIARIENITSANWYKTYLTGLNDTESYDVFDLKIVKGILAINNFVMINGNEVPYDIYQKKKRIDEIRRLLNQS